MLKHLSYLELSIGIILYFLQWYDTLELSNEITVAAVPLVRATWYVALPDSVLRSPSSLCLANSDLRLGEYATTAARGLSSLWAEIKRRRESTGLSRGAAIPGIGMLTSNAM